IGAFAVLGCLSTPERPVEKVDDLAGLGRTQPLVGVLLVVFLFSLIGIPATAGFMGKLLLFMGAVGVKPPAARPAIWFRLLALIAVINSAIGAWYHRRIAAVMYLRNPSPQRPPEPVRAWPALAVVCLCAVVTLVAGVYPPALLAGIQGAVAQQQAQPAEASA